VCAPGGIAAKLLNIPLYIHEQNSIIGLTNKLLSYFARKVFTGFPGVLKLSPSPDNKKIIFTGNPVREDILNLPAKLQIHHPIRLLIIGGSRGAAILNELLPKTAQLIPTEVQVEICHQTGKNLTANYSYVKDNITVNASHFIDDMGKVYEWADIIICRSGALTLAEITAIGIPAILIPYPHAVDDHQTTNAKYLANNQAAILLNQTELTPEILLKNLMELFQPEHYTKMAQASRALRQEKTIQRILDHLND
jgi:UDP-N-acetylglucosamine--N-acetylmuramyl-(pentapeptide) pyrophosphoryl-undecaprenol N-acetylglucosamine transferase